MVLPFSHFSFHFAEKESRQKTATCLLNIDGQRVCERYFKVIYLKIDVHVQTVQLL